MTRPATLSDARLGLLWGALFALGMIMVALDLPTWVYDLVRSVVLVESVAIFAASAVIVRVYWRNFKIAPEKARLLPRHVVQLGILLMCLIFSLCAVTIARIDTRPAWYGLPFLLSGLTVGLLGLYDMVAWLPDRRKNLRMTGEDHG